MRAGLSSPVTCPGTVRAPRVLLFPVRRMPHRDGEGSGSHETAAGLFKGVNVLVVEDDFIVAFDMQSLLEEEGARVLGPAATLTEAREILAKESPAVAVLDVNLNGEYVFPLVADLRARGVPFLFATAYADDDRLFPQEMRAAPRLAKPVLPNTLIRQLIQIVR